MGAVRKTKAKKAEAPTAAPEPKGRCKWLDDRSYNGPILHGKYQVCELGYGLDCFALYSLRDRFFIRDHRGTLHFSSIEQAERHADQLVGIRPAKQPKAAKAKAPGPKAQKPSAAGMFRDLIVEGKLSDDEIFAKVKAQFNLPDSRRGYVDWYRKDLKKKGILQ